MKRICSACKVEKEISEFSKDKFEKSGYCYKCKICRNKYYQEYYKNNPEKTKIKNNKQIENRKNYYLSENGIKSSRKAHLKRKYNITLEEYEEMNTLQNGKCAICSKTEMNNKNSVLCVDHDHTTNKVRGLLCGLCNTALGNFLDNKTNLFQAIKYLEKYE
jgi:hypothetical protein